MEEKETKVAVTLSSEKQPPHLSNFTAKADGQMLKSIYVGNTENNKYVNKMCFTSGSRRKQRWNQSVGVQDRGREPASAGSPAHPGKPEHPWLPSSSAQLTRFHLHPHYLNHGVLSQVRGTWCLDPEYSSKTIWIGWVRLAKGFCKFNIQI